MKTYLYDELGEKEVDNRKKYYIPIYIAPNGISISLYHGFPLNDHEWKRINSIVEAIRSTSINHARRNETNDPPTHKASGG